MNHATIVNNWRGFLVEDLIDENYFDSSSINEELLNEIGADTFRDVAQFLVGAAVEYGLVAGTVGAGTPVAAAAETALDAFFGAEAIYGAVQEFSQIGTKLGEYQQLWAGAMASWKGNFSTFYESVKTLIQKLFQDLGSKIGSSIDKMAAKLRNMVKNLVAKMMRPIEKGIQLVIPDAAIGQAAAKAFSFSLKKASNNIYDVIMSLVSKFEIVRNFVTNPNSAIATFKDLFKTLAETFRKIATALKSDKRFIKVLKVMNPALYLAATKLGPRIANSMADKFEKQAPKILDILGSILKVLIPSLMAAGAMLQILLKGEHEEEPASPSPVDVQTGTPGPMDVKPPVPSTSPPQQQTTTQQASTRARVPQQQRAAAPTASDRDDDIKKAADDVLKKAARRRQRVAEQQKIHDNWRKFLSESNCAEKDSDEIEEVSSEKQRRWACAQKDKPASERADGLSAAEAEEMCKSKVEEDS
jgi:hypothetical protein